MHVEETPSGNLRLLSNDHPHNPIRLTRDEIRAAAALLVVSGNHVATAAPQPAPTKEPIATDPDALLTADEVAQLLRVSIDSVYLYARTARLAKVQFDRAVRFKRSEVVSFIERATSKPAKLVAKR